MSELSELVTELSGMDGASPATKGKGSMPATKKKASKKKASKKKKPASNRRTGQTGELGTGDNPAFKAHRDRVAKLRRQNPNMTQKEAQKLASQQLRKEGKVGASRKLARRASASPAPAASATTRARVQSMSTPMSYLAPWATEVSSRHSGETLAKATAVMMQVARMYDAAFEVGSGNRKAEAFLEMIIEPQIMGWVKDLPRTPEGSKTLVRKFLQENNLLLLRMDSRQQGGGYHRGLVDWLNWMPSAERFVLLKYLADWRNEHDQSELEQPRQGVPEEFREADLIAVTLAAMFNLQSFPDPNEMNGGSLSGGAFGSIRNSRMAWPSVPKNGAGQVGEVPFGNMEPENLNDVRADMAMNAGLGASASTIDLFLTLDDPFADPLLGDGSGVGFDADVRPGDQPFTHSPGSMFGEGETRALPAPAAAPSDAHVISDDATAMDLRDDNNGGGFTPLHLLGGVANVGDDNDSPESTIFG